MGAVITHMIIAVIRIHLEKRALQKTEHTMKMSSARANQ